MKRSPSKRFKAQEESSLLELVAKECYPNLSKREVKRGIEGKGCLIGGSVETFAGSKVRPGNTIEVFEQPFTSQDEVKSPVVFEDEHLIVYNKQAGQVCDEPLQVHRLDKETSGLYMVAKSEQMHDMMCSLFKKRAVQKRYVALVARKVQEKGGKIESKLRVKKRLQGQKVWGSDPRHGLYARTDWKRVATEGSLSKLSISPQTGRMHQIRVHMAEMGHPVLGDYHYGRAFPVHVFRHMLHAESLTFVHPITKKRLTLHAEAPF